MAKALRIFIVGFLIGLILAHNAHGQVRCASYLGMCHPKFPCDQALAVFSGIETPCLGWLHTTFGAMCTCPKRFLATEGKKIVRVHVVNGTCFKERGRTCAKDEVFYQETIASADRKFATRNPALMRKYRRKLQEVKRMVYGRSPDAPLVFDPGVEFYLSLCLECPLETRARRTMHRVAAEVFPGVPLVDSVLTQKCLPGAICEKHGSGARVPAGGIIDSDGEDFRAFDSEAWIARNRGAIQAHGWIPGFNLLAPGSTRFELPLQRNNPPTRQDFRDLREWLVPSSGL